MEKNEASVLEKFLSAVLYEGYILFPYRVSALKNRKRFTFGRVYPEALSAPQSGSSQSGASSIQVECLVQGDCPRIAIAGRFLQPLWREVLKDGKVVDQVEVGGRLLQTWQEAIERTVPLPDIDLAGASSSRESKFEFQPDQANEPEIAPGLPLGVTIRRRLETITGVVRCQAVTLAEQLWKVSVQMKNTSSLPEGCQSLLESNQEDALLMHTFASTHMILQLSGKGRFVSLLDPQFASFAAQCRNFGVWPVLIGEEHQADCMLASPILLYDYPKLAAESRMNHFDGTEIDELLALQIMALTDAEKAQMRQADPRARQILESIETLQPEEFLRMHGVMRETACSQLPPLNEPEGAAAKIAGATVEGVFLEPGSRVRICPAQRGDAMDMMLADKLARIESVEQDMEGQVYFALVLEEDPGKEIGFARQPGHRFFFLSTEVKPVLEREE